MKLPRGKWIVTQILTERCNLDCLMCFQSQIRKKKNAELPLLKINDFYSKHRKEIMAVNITGGEPFLRPDCIELSEKLDKLGIVTSINTNGTLLTPEIIDRLAQLSFLRSVIISVDGSREIHEAIRKKRGIFEKTVNNIRLLTKKIRINAIQINTMILPETVTGLEDHITYFESLGIRRFELIFSGSYSREEQDRSTHILDQCGIPEVVVSSVDDESLRELSTINIETISDLIQNHPESRINVVPKTYLRHYHLFKDNKLDSFNVHCSKLMRKELRIDSSGQIILCDTLRIPLGRYEETKHLDDIFAVPAFIKLKKAITLGLPCCKRCCKSTRLVMKKEVSKKMEEEAVCQA